MDEVILRKYLKLINSILIRIRGKVHSRQPGSVHVTWGAPYPPSGHKYRTETFKFIERPASKILQNKMFCMANSARFIALSTVRSPPGRANIVSIHKSSQILYITLFIINQVSSKDVPREIVHKNYK